MIAMSTTPRSEDDEDDDDDDDDDDKLNFSAGRPQPIGSLPKVFRDVGQNCVGYRCKEYDEHDDNAS
jgi:hypothetical protein